MKWKTINVGGVSWVCEFEKVPFKVKVYPHVKGVEAILYFIHNGSLKELTSTTYSSVDVAQVEVENFVLNHLALYSAQVHRECLEANVMTWRKLKEQLDQIPDEQLDLPINHLDTDGYWVRELRIVIAEQDQYMDNDHRDVTDSSIIVEDQKLVVEKGKYFLSTCNV